MAKSVIACGTLAILVACFVAAQSPRPDTQELTAEPRVLDLFDTDRNGELSQTEVQQANHILSDRDRNGDGVVKRDELNSLHRPHQPAPRDGKFRPHRQTTEDITADQSLAKAPRGTVVFQGGYDTDSRDGGRPVVLIAAALGVSSDVFREAFSGVRPARGGGPSRAQAHANKKVLLDALSKHGVTNERLDEVSDYYRYQPESGSLWHHKPARAVAVIENDRVTGLKIVDAGAGYSSSPRAVVAGFPDLKITCQIEMSENLTTNGRIHSLKVSD